MRESLGAALVEAGKPRETEGVFREDLEYHLSNARSLFGLHASLVKQARTRRGLGAARLLEGWTNADVTLTLESF